MKDRIPLDNGKNNSIKLDLTNISNFDELKAANTAGTLKADVFANNDGTGTQEIGTALNKANLLSDTTATKLGLTPANNPTVNDAFSALDIQKIGDIKTTIRTDLGNKWLLCNGADINKNTYPDLNNVLPDVEFTYGKARTISFTNGDRILDIYKDNNQYIILSFYYSGATIYYRIWTATTINSIGDLTLVNTITLSLYDSSRDLAFGRIGKIGSNYVIILSSTVEGQYDNSGYYYSRLVLNFYYSTSLSVTFTKTKSLETASTYTLTTMSSEFVVNNGKISIIIFTPNAKGVATNYACIFNSTDGITWVNFDLINNLSTYITAASTVHGYGYYNGYYYFSYTTSSYYGIMRSYDLITWTNLINSTTTSILGLTYLNGVFYYGNNSKLYYTTDFVTTYSLTGTISNFLLWNDGVNIYNCNNKIIFGTSSFSLSADTIPLLNITSGNLIQVTNKIIVQRGSNNNLFINLDLENKKLPFFSSVSGGNTTECYYIRALG